MKYIYLCPECKHEITQWNGGIAKCNNCPWRGYYPNVKEKIND